MKDQIHVYKHPEVGWFVQALFLKGKRVFQTQQSAINHAIRQAKTQGNTEVIIHSRNEKIRESNTYNRKKGD